MSRWVCATVEATHVPCTKAQVTDSMLAGTPFLYMHTPVHASDGRRKGLLAEPASRKRDRYLQPSARLGFLSKHEHTLNCKNYHVGTLWSTAWQALSKALK